MLDINLPACLGHRLRDPGADRPGDPRSLWDHLLPPESVQGETTTFKLCELWWKHSVTVTVFIQTYSFDLQRPPPSSHLNEPTGTFEPMCLDDLGGWITWLKPHILLFWSVYPIADQVVYVDQVTPDGFSPSSCANGTAPRSDEKAPDDQTDTTRGAADAGKPPREKDA